MEHRPWLTQTAARHPGGLAVAHDGGDATWEQLEAWVAAAASALAGEGVGPRDRVAIVLAPGLDSVVALHACLRLGAVAMPVDVRLTEAERAAQCAGAAVTVAEPLPVSGAMAEPRPFAYADLAMIVHTSGSSGAPVPIEQTYGNWLWSALGSAVALGLPRQERWLCALPLAHVGGLSVLMRGAIYGMPVVLHERFDVDRVLAELRRPDGPTAVSLVPTTLARLLDAGLHSPPALRCALVGGAPIPSALVDRARDAGVPVSATYGLTEACSQVATVPPGWADQTAAPPLFANRVAIAPDGEILVSGPTVALGAVADDGWLHTGDLGTMDERGWLTPVGRKATTIVSGGENVSPEEVEGVLESHPAVVEAAVLGVCDTQWGEAVAARVVVTPDTGVTTDDLVTFARERLAGFKAPKTIEIVERLPRTPSGKLRRDALT